MASLSEHERRILSKVASFARDADPVTLGETEKALLQRQLETQRRIAAERLERTPKKKRIAKLARAMRKTKEANGL